MEPLQWIFVVTALTLIFIVFATSPLQAAINEAVDNNARLQSQRLASVINMISTAPDGTSYTFEMPSSKCKAIITDSFVELTITFFGSTDISHTVSLIKTSTRISPNPSEFNCESNHNIQLIKNNGVLNIKYK